MSFEEILNHTQDLRVLLGRISRGVKITETPLELAYKAMTVGVLGEKLSNLSSLLKDALQTQCVLKPGVAHRWKAGEKEFEVTFKTLLEDGVQRAQFEIRELGSPVRGADLSLVLGPELRSGPAQLAELTRRAEAMARAGLQASTQARSAYRVLDPDGNWMSEARQWPALGDEVRSSLKGLLDDPGLMLDR